MTVEEPIPHTPSVALHVGESVIEVAHSTGDMGSYVLNMPAHYLQVKPEVLAGTHLEDRSIECWGNRLLIGNDVIDARRWGIRVGETTRCGRFRLRDRISSFAFSMICKALLGTATEVGQTCYYLVPSPPLGNHSVQTYDQFVTEQVLAELGYKAVALQEGQLLALTRTSSSRSRTVLSFYCDMSQIDWCLSHRGIANICHSISPGGDWVDKQVALVLRTSKRRASTLRRRMHTSLFSPKTMSESVIAHFCSQLINHTLEQLARYFETHGTPLLSDALEVVWAGSWVPPPGFSDFLHIQANSENFPFKVQEVHWQHDTNTGMAQQCLDTTQMYALY